MASASDGGGSASRTDRSAWASTIGSINPFGGSRSSTPTPREPSVERLGVKRPDTIGNDHSTRPFYGISTNTYPKDCPRLRVKWYHAADIPKSKPEFLVKKKKNKQVKESTKPDPLPKKYVPFSSGDSQSIEKAYQGVLEAADRDTEGSDAQQRMRSGTSNRQGRSVSISSSRLPNSSLNEVEEAVPSHGVGVRVPVNEDFLFDVDLERRELAPVYWLGPTYDVRRGTWFYQEGSSLRPCEENLAAQLEEGYLKVKPWQYPVGRTRSDSTPKRSSMIARASSDDLKSASVEQAESSSSSMGPPPPPQSHRLFGAWMNSVATFQDSTTAFVSSDSVLSWVTSTMYERFSSGGYLSGIKVVRGYTEARTAVDPKRDIKRPSTPTEASSRSKTTESTDLAHKRRSAPPTTTSTTDFAAEEVEPVKVKQEVPDRGSLLTRQLSSLMEVDARNPDAEAEAIRQREEEAIRDDYNAPEGETQGREIEHLVLVTHGIGQLLGLKMESINFVHDVNTMRKTLKAVYTTSEDLKALNSETGEGPGNCRIQVLPVCWRHLLDFPRKRDDTRNEQDIGMTANDEDEYPALEDITVEGVAFARSLIADLALDILLYQSAYRAQICEIVFREANRIYNLFIARNPGFKGKIHFMGHSLGSAIMFDILCRQKERGVETEAAKNPLRFWPGEDTREEKKKDPTDLTFNFGVDSFYCLGSPIGLFQMLKGRTISARHLTKGVPTATPFHPEEIDDPFLSAPIDTGNQRISPITGLPYSVSSPKVEQLFNVFHPSDPIAYRLEPLITPAMSSLKPQLLPYTKTGIFANVAPQGITGIGAKVTQGVSGLWSSLSTGIASNLLNRSLGFTQEDVAKITADAEAARADSPSSSSSSSSPSSSSSSSSSHQQLTSPGAGTNIAAGVIQDTSELSRQTSERQKKLAEGAAAATGGGVASAIPSSITQGQDSSSSTANMTTGLNKTTRPGMGNREMTLIDDDLETLFSQFQKKRMDNTDQQSLEDEGAREKWREEEKKAARLRREEVKVRALNRNGRVDYSIQESVLDFNPITTIASHMSYWADEDVNHFIISQLLSNKKKPS